MPAAAMRGTRGPAFALWNAVQEPIMIMESDDAGTFLQGRTGAAMTTRLLRRSLPYVIVPVLASASAIGCSRSEGPDPAAPELPPSAGRADEPLPDTPSPYDALPESVRATLDTRFTGDLDAIRKRRALRVGVTYSRTHYFVDRGEQRGLAYEALMQFEKELNAGAASLDRVHVIFIPLPRDVLLPALVDGRIDAVAAMLTDTPERRRIVAFSEPTRTNVSEVVVTGPGAPPIHTVDDLAGQTVFVRKSSSYYESLERLNEQLASRGRPAVIIEPAPEVFEDDDLLEMANAGLAPIVIVDDYLAEFWSQVFTSVQVHRDVALRSGGNVAVAVRQGNPELRAAVNAWVKAHAEGDAFRNVIDRRYLGNAAYVKNAASEAERRKFQEVVALFRKYGDQYGIDYLLVAAQGYQESTLDHSVRSPAGAIGIMQVMPATGRELAVGDITRLEPNIHAGVKYMRFMIDRYFADEPMDDLNKGLMAFAAYNAGPGRLRQLRRLAEERGLDRNVWFGNVERIASEKIGRETVQYVSNIYKYYVTYRLLAAQQAQREQAKTPGR